MGKKGGNKKVKLSLIYIKEAGQLIMKLSKEG